MCKCVCVSERDSGGCWAPRWPWLCARCKLCVKSVHCSLSVARLPGYLSPADDSAAPHRKLRSDPLLDWSGLRLGQGPAISTLSQLPPGLPVPPQLSRHLVHAQRQHKVQFVTKHFYILTCFRIIEECFGEFKAWIWHTKWNTTTVILKTQTWVEQLTYLIC